MGLAVVALFVFGASVQHLAAPAVIRFNEAIGVACIGLAVNLVCAFLLREDHHHEALGGQHHDHNLRGAYLHVLADALTSVLAIAALTAGKLLGWTWMDPIMGLVGSAVIARWSHSLLRDTSRVLLDAELPEARRQDIQTTLELDADNRVTDLHVWRVGPRHLAAIVAIVTHTLVHVTVEVHGRPDGQRR